MPVPIKVMKLRYAGTCSCGVEISAGTRAGWDREARTVVCESCLVLDSPLTVEVEATGSSGRASATHLSLPSAELVAIPPPDEPTDDVAVQVSEAGASLQREHDRRSAKREQRIRTRFPRAGGLILAVTDDPQSTKAFKAGADGERRAAAKIVETCSPDVLFLLNRTLGSGRRDGDIDMIAVSAAGVHIIDVKRYTGAKVEVRRTGGFLSKVTEQLMVGGRDRTTMLDGLAKQVAAVRIVLATLPQGSDLVVSRSLCFVDADLPLFGTPRITDVECRSPKGIAAMLKSMRGQLDQPARIAILSHLAEMLPPAA